MTSRTGGRNKRGTPEHDRGYRRLFSHPESIEDLLRGFVEDGWVDDLDFSSLEKVDHHFVGDDFGGRASDVIWKMRFRDGKRKGGSVYVYLLLELQSTSYHFMPVRMLTYSGLLLEQVIRTEKLKTGDLLPAILPFVFNSGPGPWRGPLSLSRLFPPLPPGLEKHLPRLDCLLLDERQMDLTRPGLEDNRLAAAFRIETCQAPEMPRLARELDALLPREKAPELRRSYNVWLRSVLRRTYKGVIIPDDFDLEDASMLEESARKWEKRFLREGRKEGLQEGLKKGFRKGEVLGLKLALLQLMEQRFGPLPEPVRKQVEKINAKRELERLLNQVVEVKSLADMRISQPSRKPRVSTLG